MDDIDLSFTSEGFTTGKSAHDDLNKVIVGRLKSLSLYVASEIESLASSMRQLQEENQELRERLALEYYKQKHSQHSGDGHIVINVDSARVALEKYKRKHSQPLGDGKTVINLDEEYPETFSEKFSDFKVESKMFRGDGAIQPSLKATDVDSVEEPEGARFADHSSEPMLLTLDAFVGDKGETEEDGESPEMPEMILRRKGDTGSKRLARMQSTVEERSSLRKTKRSGRGILEFHCLEIWTLEEWQRRPSSTFMDAGSVMSTEMKFKMIVQMMEDRQDERPDCYCCTLIQPYMLSPTSRASIAIDVVSVSMIAYDCVAVPLLLLESSDTAEHLVTSAMTWISRIFWTLAIPRTLLTGFMKDDGTIEMQATMVFREYRNSWLLLDVFIVAADWVDASAGGVVRIVRLLKAARLARMVQIPRLIERMNNAKSEKMWLWLNIMKSTVTFVILNHFLACIWYWIGTLNDLGWVSERGIENASIMHKYGYAIHWSASQFIGSTEVFPKTGLERGFGSCVMIFAFICSASFISKITAAMTRLQILAGKTRMLFSSLRRFLVHCNLSQQLRIRVLSAAKHNLALKEHNETEADVELLKYLSEPMLIEIHYEVHSGVLMQHPFFRSFNHFEPLAVQKLCHSAVDMLTLGVGDVLFTQGVEPTNPRMFFPQEGTLLYMKDLDGDGQIDLDEMVQVKQPMWICEPVLWMKWTHMGYLRAAQHCSVLALSAEQFCSIVQEFKNTNYPAEYATQIVVKVNLVCQHEIIDDLLEGIDSRELAAQVFPKQGVLSGFGSMEWGRRWSESNTR